MTTSSPYLIITGASRGIGLATAQLFATRGWNVINLSRNACPISSVRNISIDLAKLPEQIETVKQQLTQLLPEMAQISLVHNAAICVNDTVETLEYEVFQNTLKINVIVPALLNQLVLSRMQPGSSILYIGSTFSEKAVPGWASYITSKHAIAGLMKSTCQDLAGQRIHTCCICPGPTETEMLQQRFKVVPGLEETLAALSSENRLVQSEEIAEVIWFSANNSVMNGAVLHANLGQIDR